MTTTRILAGGFCASAVALGLGRFAYTPILPMMALDATTGGWLAAANNGGYLIGSLWAGTIRGDRARHLILDLGLALVALSLAAMAVPVGPWGWALIRLVAGIGSALVFILSAALVLPFLAGRGQGRLAGFKFGGVGLGITLAGSVIAASGGWPMAGFTGAPTAWAVSGILCAVIAVIAHWGLRPLRTDETANGGARHAPGLPFSLMWLGGAYACAGFGYIVTGTFLVVVVRAAPDLADWANLAWVVVGLAAVPSAAAWGWIAERKGHARALIAAHALMAAGTLLLGLTHHPAGILMSALLYGGTFLGIAGMAVAFGRAITPDRATWVVAMLTIGFSAGQIAGPVAAAALAQIGGWPLALGAAAAVTAAGVPMLVIGGRRRPV